MSLMRTIGQKCFDNQKIIISVWVVVLITAGAVGLTQKKELSNAISIPGTQAQQALDEVATAFPESGKGQGRVVFNVDGDITKQFKSINSIAESIKDIEGVSGVITPSQNPNALAKDNKTVYLDIQLDESRGSVSMDTIESVKKLVDAYRMDNPQVQAEIGGDIVNVSPEEIIGIGEIGGILVALMVLIITLGALIAAGMPILIAVVSVGVSMGILFGLSNLVDITVTTPVLAVMLGLAVGIDYSLFIIMKYRKYLKRGYTYRDAAIAAVATAGNAVVFAALTVVIALAALSVVNIPFMTIMGLVGAGTIAIAALAAVTLLPALLSLTGGRIFNVKDRKRVVVAQKSSKKTALVDKKTMWHKTGEFITRHPVAVIIFCLVIVSVAAWPAKDLKLGLPTDQYAANDTTQRRAYDILKSSFGPGFNGPLIVLVQDVEPVTEQDVSTLRRQAMTVFNAEVARQTQAKQQQYAKLMATVSTPEQAAQISAKIAEEAAKGEQQKQAALKNIDEQMALYKKFGNIQPIAEQIMKDNRVSQATPALVSEDGRTALLQVISKNAPSDSQTIKLIEDMRDNNGAFASITQSIQITGSAALEADVNKKLAAALPIYLSVIVGLSFILLLVAFRSVLIPIKATLGFLMSLAVMMGFIVATFQWGWFGITDAPGPIVSFIPIIGMGILFGLAMDYEFFLVSGMHETYSKTKDVKHSIADGFALGAKVVTAAALIMVSIFAAFVFSPDQTIQSIGLGLAVGIAVDAFIVRMLFVTAVMQLLGKAAWWLPRWVGRIIPNVSIEGKER
jgi:putative drug exporter of the RND superfamily